VDDWFAITEFHHCRCHGSGGRPIRAGRVIRGAGSQPAASILVSTNDVRAGHARPTRMVPAVGARHASLSQVNARHEYLRRHRCLVT
jgi:hypothetical protein